MFTEKHINYAIKGVDVASGQAERQREEISRSLHEESNRAATVADTRDRIRREQAEISKDLFEESARLKNSIKTQQDAIYRTNQERFIQLLRDGIEWKNEEPTAKWEGLVHGKTPFTRERLYIGHGGEIPLVGGYSLVTEPVSSFKEFKYLLKGIIGPAIKQAYNSLKIRRKYAISTQ